MLGGGRLHLQHATLAGKENGRAASVARDVPETVQQLAWVIVHFAVLGTPGRAQEAAGKLAGSIGTERTPSAERGEFRSRMPRISRMRGRRGRAAHLS